MVIARTPASLFTVHLPSLSNHWPPACRRMGSNWKAVHCEACIAHLNPWRVNFEPSLTVSRLATSPSCSHVGLVLDGVEADLLELLGVDVVEHAVEPERIAVRLALVDGARHERGRVVVTERVERGVTQLLHLQRHDELRVSQVGMGQSPVV